MRKAVNAYLNAYKNLLSAFGCGEEYFVSPALSCKWQIVEGEMPLLSYSVNEKIKNSVIVCDGEKPLVYRAGGYAMVIAIDCVKVAFILDESKETGRK